jgi:hypothetical protein
MHLLRRHGAHADRRATASRICAPSRARPRPVAAHQARLKRGRRRRLRVHRVPRRHRGHLRPDPREALGPQAGQGLQARLLAGAHQPGRSRAHARAHREGRLRRRRAHARRASPSAYGAIIDGGRAPAASIKVAEAAKVIENTQRDLNIALMNELSLIFDRMGIRTRDVLAAAGTKWNFLKFTRASSAVTASASTPTTSRRRPSRSATTPQVILAGRRINDGMGAYVAQKLIKLLIGRDIPVKGAKVGILGLTFKENVPDSATARCRTSSRSSASSASSPSSTIRTRRRGAPRVRHPPHAAREAHGPRRRRLRGLARRVQGSRRREAPHARARPRRGHRREVDDRPQGRARGLGLLVPKHEYGEVAQGSRWQDGHRDPRRRGHWGRAGSSRA